MQTLVDYLAQLPATRVLSTSEDLYEENQEIRALLREEPGNERLPTVFMPTSSPPYMNGGPLEGRLPRPLSDLSQWARCSSGPCDVPESA
jgi:hypothetical protein